jgi:hypothetical protein
MHPIKQVPPEAMTPAERRAEIAALLANGLVRLRVANAASHAEERAESAFVLGFGLHQRVYSDPVNQPSESR